MKKRKYYIDYIHSNTTDENFYHQLVRKKDGAILYANKNLDNIYLYCFKHGITKNQIIVL